LKTSRTDVWIARAGTPAAVVAAVLAAGALALAAPQAAAEITLTVYNEDLALVRETRAFDLAAGVNTVEVTDVPALIDPTSVHLASLTAPDKLTVLEQNFVYDLVNAERLLEKYLDRSVQVLTKQGGNFKGTLKSFDGSAIVVAEPGESRMTLVSRPEVESVMLAGEDVSLVTRPTLVWLLRNGGAAKQEIALEYLTRGVAWHAEYAGVLDKDEASLDLAAWVSLDNRSGRTYPDARLRVVAGSIHRAEEKFPIGRYAGREAAMAAEAPQFEAREFFEYKLYALERKTTVRDRETKQLSLFPNARTKIEKRFTYDARRDDKRCQVSVLFKNKKETGLGIALPAGVIRLYKDDGDGGVGLLGEDRVEHTPKDEEVEVVVGKAFDIVAERTHRESRQISDRMREDSIEIKLRNHKKDSVDVLVREGVWGDWEVLRSTFPSKRKDAQTIEFTVPVAPDQEAVLAYTVRTRW